MTKTNHPNTAKKNAPKKRTKHKVFNFEIYDLFTGRSKPVSEDYLENIGKEALKWAMELKHPQTARSYFRERGISSDTTFEWCQRSPIFHRYYRTMLDTLADRLVIGAITKELDGNFVKWKLPSYGQEWRDLHKFHADLRKQEESQKGNVVIQMVDYGEGNAESH